MIAHSNPNHHQILIVESDQVAADVIRYNLERSGYATCVAKSRNEGLMLAKLEKFDLIIFDYEFDAQLHKGQLGHFSRSLKKTSYHKETPYFFLLKESHRINPQELQETSQAARVIPIPFSPSGLVSKVQEFLESGPIQICM